MKKKLLFTLFLIIVLLISFQERVLAYDIVISMSGAKQGEHLEPIDGQVSLSKDKINILLGPEDNKDTLSIVLPVKYDILTNHGDAWPGDKSTGTIEIDNQSGQEYQFESVSVSYRAGHFSRVYNSAIKKLETDLSLPAGRLNNKNNWNSLTQMQKDYIEENYYAACEASFGADRLANPIRDNDTIVYLLACLNNGKTSPEASGAGNALLTEPNNQINTISEKLLFNKCITFFIGKQDTSDSDAVNNRTPVASFQSQDNTMFKAAFSKDDRLTIIDDEGLDLKYSTEIDGPNTGNFFQNAEFAFDFVIELRKVGAPTEQTEQTEQTEGETPEGALPTENAPETGQTLKATSPSEQDHNPGTGDTDIIFIALVIAIATGTVLIGIARKKGK